MTLTYDEDAEPSWGEPGEDAPMTTTELLRWDRTLVDRDPEPRAQKRHGTPATPEGDSP